ncbi:hypothetical protein Bca52824_095332 [Brassica carinata]|uniref:Uncharacterized protein n=1 Tax=Brassica carinata TaxID=52824 RepID=A0A8X7TJV6_BRACI|nr:hypothetical protein Bca52824_095332 [Brassica carinata]
MKRTQEKRTRRDRGRRRREVEEEEANLMRIILLTQMCRAMTEGEKKEVEAKEFTIRRGKYFHAS